MTDPITFNTDKGSVGSSRVKNWLGMDARLGPGTGLGWASLLDALEQIPSDRLVDGFLECAAADPAFSMSSRDETLCCSHRPAFAVAPGERAVDDVADEAHDATG
jgi:hypothetical protein